MSDPYIGQTLDMTLGQDFLTWLWFYADTTAGQFSLNDGTQYSIHLEQRVVVTGGEGESLETTTVSGSMSPLREARIGLASGKKVCQALLRIERNAEVWTATVKAESLSLSGLKTPTVEREKADDDFDDDARVLEKLYLVESVTDMIDNAFDTFMEVRLNPTNWAETIKRIRPWLTSSPP
jgi:hypothetical protein